MISFQPTENETNSSLSEKLIHSMWRGVEEVGDNVSSQLPGHGSS